MVAASECSETSPERAKPSLREGSLDVEGVASFPVDEPLVETIVDIDGWLTDLRATHRMVYAKCGRAYLRSWVPKHFWLVGNRRQGRSRPRAQRRKSCPVRGSRRTQSRSAGSGSGDDPDSDEPPGGRDQLDSLGRRQRTGGTP